MNANVKTKETIIGANINTPSILIFRRDISERAFVYKLLGGLIIDDVLNGTIKSTHYVRKLHHDQ